MHRFFLSTLAAATLLWHSGAARAHSLICGDRATIVDDLAARFAERPVARGLANDGRVVELLATADGKTWTLIVTTPDGIACLIAPGRGWDSLPNSLTSGPAT